MFGSRTLLVLGAGASKEFGLPTGRELTVEIANRLDIKFEFYNQKSGDYVIAQAFRQLAQDINPLRHAAQRVKDGMRLANSIDSYIDIHKDDDGVKTSGKLAIVRSILAAERNSTLFFEPRNAGDTLDFSQLDNTWLLKFFRILSDGISKERIQHLFDNVAIINFNYDRCLEHFLVHAIRTIYGVNEVIASETMARLRIFHPYGAVGQLPWQNKNVGVPFGEEIDDPRALLALSQGIRTFTEEIQVKEQLSELRREVGNAGVIVFLGFAFHPQNMQLITPTQSGANLGTSCHVFASALDVSMADCKILERTVAFVLNGAGKRGTYEIRSGLSCSELFDQHWRGMARAY